MSSTPVTSATDAAVTPFEHMDDCKILSKQKIVELYQSRCGMTVLFGCIDIKPTVSVVEPDSSIPEEVAFQLYGQNDSVTLLGTFSGALSVLDGRKCFPIWRELVRNKELPAAMVFNVIITPTTLSNIQRLQLATFCNIQSRPNGMRSLSEKIALTKAFFQEFSAGSTEQPCAVAEMNRETYNDICTSVSAALYRTTIFDYYFYEPPLNTSVVEDFVSGTVGVCLALTEEHELMALIKRMLTTSSTSSEVYFDVQFFYDYRSKWFAGAPVLKQMILVLILSLLPPLRMTDQSTQNTARQELRNLVRKRVPHICDALCCCIAMHHFQELQETNTCSPYPGSVDSREEDAIGDDIFWVVQSLARQAFFSIQRIETHMLNGRRRVKKDTMTEMVVHETRDRIRDYISRIPSFTVDHLLM